MLLIPCMHAKFLQSYLTLCDSMDVACQAPLSMGFSRQEYGGGLPCPSPGNLPDPGIEPTSLLCPALTGGFFPPQLAPPGNLGDAEGQGGLVCCSPWGCKELDMTGRLNNNNEGMCFPGGAAVKNLPAMQETQEMQIRALGREDPRKKEMATHSSIFAWKVPWTERSGGLRSMGLQRAGHD